MGSWPTGVGSPEEGIMSTITAYKCDVCSKITEDTLPFTLPHGPNFEVKDRQPCSYEGGACSQHCVKGALEMWFLKRASAEAKEQG